MALVTSRNVLLISVQKICKRMMAAESMTLMLHDSVAEKACLFQDDPVMVTPPGKMLAPVMLLTRAAYPSLLARAMLTWVMAVWMSSGSTLILSIGGSPWEGLRVSVLGAWTSVVQKGTMGLFESHLGPQGLIVLAEVGSYGI